jgi:Fe-S-cluster containining protein
MPEPWYRAGLRFSCTRCGACCAGPQEGYVWVNAEELDQIAQQLGVPREELERRYVCKVGIRRSLRLKPNNDCVFYDGTEKRCTIYGVRPRQCRSWPFWESNVRTEESWRDTCAVCPGAGHGNFVPYDEIVRQVSTIRI